MPTLHYSLGRSVDWDELHCLIFGTGALSFPWWHDVTITTRDGAPEGDWESVTFVADDPDTNEPETYRIPPSRILWAFGRRYEGRNASELHPEILEAITSDIGLLDALEADAVLQLAVFGEIVYG